MNDEPKDQAAACAGPASESASATVEELREQVSRLNRQMQSLSEIGLALSAEQDRNRLLEMIVELARNLTYADAGTLYIVDPTGMKLEFVVLQNDTMNVRLGGTSGNPVTLPPVHLYKEGGEPNHANVSSHVALTREFVNIDDVYCAEGFDFSGTRGYDKATGYHSQSMLVTPMVNHESEIIGVLQLLNAKDKDTGAVVGFNQERLEAVRSLASQAAVALTNTQLINGLKELLYSFMQSIAAAIDAKSPYTKGHIDRVVDLTMRIAETINAQTEGPYADVHFNANELEELKLAAWMHDVGKITTPVHVVDKSTKLEAIVDRIEFVRTRFKLIGKALQAELLERLLEMAGRGAARSEMVAVTEEMEKRRQELEEDLAFIESCNKPGEFMSDDRIARVKEIAARTYDDNGEQKPWLSENEVLNLCIRKGSLTDAERKIIEDHTVVTFDMLGRLPFPKRLARIPEFAGSHHEKLDGTGYPNHLTAESLSLQARILAVADVFEALTAKDRPYKEPMKLSQAVKILGFMCKDKHVDPDVFSLFLQSGVYKDYAQTHLNAEQIDEVQMPGSPPPPPADGSAPAKA
ncbi:MAG: HD domain-containing phosphohydrolase [Humidesulfovibrio sp.]|uniref:HD domain-containing phosphohydrolase n=1 Tax=Humidesulfovibrio sp. TaxID=2910988 RepID=UPI0027F76D80|nr:HD domain-containing phosphohydrolase [Humidesulfovibrio sp.]MDQ7833890.1 HD domain-containing phosphohydrolase [Humidesulfovibrio sp.]